VEVVDGAEKLAAFQDHLDDVLVALILRGLDRICVQIEYVQF
jgi:hypothetical protein